MIVHGASRRVGTLALVAAVGLVGAGCGSGAGGGSGSTTLTLYSAQHEQTTNALVAAFTRQTGIHVRVDDNDEAVLTAQIEQEGRRSSADVFYAENSNWLEQLAQQDLLAPVDPTTLTDVPAVDRSATGMWVGISARVSALVYNTDKLHPADLPTSVLELADPKWKGKIELAPTETDFWPVVSAIAHADGQTAALAWLRGLKANAGANANVPDNETLTSDVATGATQLALINHYYFYRLQAERGAGSVHAAIAYFAPHDPGYIEVVSGAAVLKSSKHMAAAQQLLAFLTGAAGQQILATSDSFEYPLHPGVAANAVLTPLSQLQPYPFTPAQLGTGLDAKTLLQDAGLI